MRRLLLTLVLLAMTTPVVSGSSLTDNIVYGVSTTQPGSENYYANYASYGDLNGHPYINFGYTHIYPPGNPWSTDLAFSNVPFTEWMAFSSPQDAYWSPHEYSWIQINGILDGSSLHGGLHATVKDVSYNDLPPVLQGLANGTMKLQLVVPLYSVDVGRLEIDAELVPQAVPEPTTLTVWGLAALGMLAVGRRRQLRARG
jgi:MYXO-CTERM domain-containing protein